MTKKSKNAILAVGAHPDDIELGAGMTLRKHILNGDEVYFIVCSNGEKGGNVKERISELEKSAEMIGAIQVFRLNYMDSMLDFRELILPIENIFNEIKPSAVFFHNPFDMHQDHNSVSKACRAAFRKAHNIYMYRSPRTSVDFAPHLFSRGTKEDIEFKEKVLRQYKSQVKKGTINLNTVRAEAIFWGSVGYPYDKTTYCEPMLINHKTYTI